MKNISIFVVFISIMTLVAACNPIQTPVTSSPVPATKSGPYPAESQPTDSTYPAPQVNTPAPILQVTPDPTLATVKGTLQLNGAPVPSAIVYLATTVKNADNQEVAVALDRAIAPTAITDSSGGFIFQNVSPGRYAMMYQGGPDTYLLYHPDRTEAILVEIAGNEVIDLGLLDYEDLPL